MVAVVAQPAPAAVEHGALAAPRRVVKVQVVEPGQRVEPLHLRALALLPVHPPEIDALLFHRVVEQLEIVLDKALVGDAKGHGFAAVRIDAHRLGKAGIDLLKVLHALRRVQVERGAQALVVHPAQKARRVGKELAVPGVAGPGVRACASPCRRPARRAARRAPQTR